jgi:MFS family permease
LPLCVFQLSFGLIYKYYSTKWVLVTLVAIFEVGSIVCAAAPNSNALIVGRVITGIGGAGISAGAFLLITFLVPLRSRPKYFGAMGSVFGITSAIGPILGGYLTSVTWRWCFWINLPVGVLSLVLLILLTPKTPPVEKRADTWFGKLKQLDPLGFILIAPAVVCLLFALEWGGTKYPWNDGRIIALFVIFGVLGLCFVASQAWRGDKATVPPRILRNRSILSGCFAYIGTGSALVIFTFYLPIWFQVIQGKSPQSSGLSLLPLLLSIVFAVIGSGIATSIIGYYTPLMIVGSALLIVGSALITLWQPDTGMGTWIGYQVSLTIRTP